MKRNFHKISCIVLSLLMLVGLFPPASAANSAATGKAIRLTNSASGYYGLLPGEFVYLGAASAGDNGFDARWRVLDAAHANNGADGIFLLTDKLVGDLSAQGGITFDTGGSSLWQGSDAQAWCRNFLTSAFSSTEQSAVMATTKSDGAYSYTSTYSLSFAASVNILNGDKVFFLSAEESAGSAYAMDSADARKAQLGIRDSAWWLRSATQSGSAVRVSAAGDFVISAVNATAAARPALNLNTQSVLLTSAAVGGKPAGMGLKAVSATSSDEWKLTLLDNTRANFAALLFNQDSGDVTIAYSGAKSGANEYVSAIIADSAGTVKYYGRLTQPTSGSGNVTFDISGRYFEGDTLYVFSEQANGDKMTDYASAFVPIRGLELPPDKIMHTVTFDSRGGSDVPAQKVADGEKAARPSQPVKDGWSFDRWNSDPECTRAFNFNTTPITSDITLYAKWIIEYYIRTYDDSESVLRQGGVILTENGRSSVGFDGAVGESESPILTLTAKPDAGYLFKEWRKGSSTGEVVSTDAVYTFTVTNGLMLYAVFEKSALPVPDLSLADDSGATFKIGKILRWESMTSDGVGDTSGTGEPKTRGYDPNNISMTLNVLDNGIPMPYSDEAAQTVLAMLSEAEYARYSQNDGFAGDKSVLKASLAGNALTVGYAAQDYIRITLSASADNTMLLTATSLSPGCVRLRLNGSEYALVTPGDINLDGEMNANDWGAVMRVLAEAPGDHDVTDYPDFTINDVRYDLWALLADMTSRSITDARSSLVDSNDWSTIMYLVAEAWK